MSKAKIIPYPITLYKVNGKVSEFKIPKNTTLIEAFKKEFADDDYCVNTISRLELSADGLPRLVVLYAQYGYVDGILAPNNIKASKVMQKYPEILGMNGEKLKFDIIICEWGAFHKEQNRSTNMHQEKISQPYDLDKMFSLQKKIRRDKNINTDVLRLCDMVKKYHTADKIEVEVW